MDITGINSITSSPTQTQQAASAIATAANQTVNQNQFLQLFTKQLQYQDPLNPMDSSQFTSQLAQFSSLEQLTSINQQMGNLISSQNSTQGVMAAGLIGKQVEFSGNTVELNNTAQINYTLSANAAKVTISISDASGTLVNQDIETSQNAGSNSYAWNGCDANGNKLQAGQYSVAISASDASGNAVNATLSTTGTVTGVSYDKNVPSLIIDGATTVQFGQITGIN